MSKRCDVCRFGLEAERQVPMYDSMPGSGMRSFLVIECRRFPRFEDRQHDDNCGEWKRK